MKTHIAFAQAQQPAQGWRIATVLVGLALLGLVVFLAIRSWKAWRQGTGRGGLKQIIGVLVLCPIGAELLLAYDDSTGDPAAIAFAVVFFAGLYGAPALLARELARRLGWGWPSLLLLFAALGTAQACLIDQSLFSVDYQGYEGWEATRDATLLPALGISALNIFTFIGGHVISSFAAPIALAEAWSPRRAKASWFGPVGIVLAVCAYVVTAGMIMSDPESHSASPTQFTVSAAIVLVFIVAAMLVGRWRKGSPAATPSRLWALPAIVMAALAVVVPDQLGQGWSALTAYLALDAAWMAVIAVTIWLRGWSLWHSAAVATTCLAMQGAVAFTYFPLLGEVAPGPKYAHNVVMLVVVVMAGAFALRRGALERDADEPATGDASVAA